MSSKNSTAPSGSNLDDESVAPDRHKSPPAKEKLSSNFGVSRRALSRWTESLDLEPRLRPDLRINEMPSELLAEKAARAKVAQRIIDEASISEAYDSRSNTTALLLVGAMNDDAAMEVMAQILGMRIQSGAVPPEGRLPAHILRVRGAKAYGILRLLAEDLTGLKAMEAEAVLNFFPPTGIVKEKQTTDVYMTAAWKEYALRSVDVWNKRRRNKLSPAQLEQMVETWLLGRTASARRGLAPRLDKEEPKTELHVSAAS